MKIHFQVAKRLRKAIARPCLPYTSFNLQQELDHTHRAIFPQVQQTVTCWYVTHGTLACICLDAENNCAAIYVHQLLNHPETPIEVAHLICIHELLHLVIPPREIDGKTVYHPPEFWEEERRLYPQRRLAQAWIWENYLFCLRRNEKRECIEVQKNWKLIWQQPRLSLSEIDLTSWEDDNSQML